MSEPVSNKRIVYLSRFDHEIDSARRVQVPAKWRPSDPETELTLILWTRGAEKDTHIRVLPPEELNKIVERTSSLSIADEKAATLLRYIGENSAIVKVDKSGRIPIPEWMVTKAAITKEVILIGLIGYFQLWSADHHAAVAVKDVAHRDSALELLGGKTI